MRMYTRMPAPNSLGYLAAVDGEDQPTLATYNYHANTSGQEEIDAVNAVVQPQMEAWQAGMASALARMHETNATAAARAQVLNATLCAQPGWPYGCGGSPCFSDAYRDGMAVGYGTPDPAKNYIGISCVPPAGGSRNWFAMDVPTDVIVSRYASGGYRSPVGVAAPQPSASGTGTTPTAMPTSTPTNAPGGFQTSASPGANYAGYLPPTATAASNAGSNPVSTAGGVIGGNPAPAPGGISPVMLAAAAAAAYFIFKGGK